LTIWIVVHGYDCVKPHSTIFWLFTDSAAN